MVPMMTLELEPKLSFGPPPPTLLRTTCASLTTGEETTDSASVDAPIDSLAISGAEQPTTIEHVMPKVMPMACRSDVIIPLLLGTHPEPHVEKLGTSNVAIASA